MTVVGNPFRFSAPIEPSELVGRAEELERLLHLARSGTFALLDAPRRFGKTSLLNAALEEWARRDHKLAIRVDFSEVLTVDDVAARIERAYGAAGHRQLDRLLRGLRDRVTLKFGPVEIGPPKNANDTSRLHDLLDLPHTVASVSGQRALVCFDEFQDVLAVSGLDGLIRSHVQHHQQHVTYVFAGSEPSLLRELFSDRARPLYSQALPVRLGRIHPPILAQQIEQKFAGTSKDAGEAAALIAAGGAGHPQRTILLAWHLWERTTTSTAASAQTAKLAIDDALEHWQPELDALWRALATNERRVAVALAHGLAPLGKDAHQLTGLARSSSAQHALHSLLEHGRAEQLPGGQHTLIDPLFSIWIAQRHARPATPTPAGEPSE
jgi:uncharacterized protein